MNSRRQKLLRVVRTALCLAMLALGPISVLEDSSVTQPTIPVRGNEEIFLNANLSVVKTGILNAALVEGRVFTLPQLCSSPYIPVRCEDLKNPYTEQPLQWREDEIGEVALVPSGDDYLLRTWRRSAKGTVAKIERSIREALEQSVYPPVVNPEGVSPPKGHSLTESLMSTHNGSRGSVYLALATLTPEERAACFVGLDIVHQLAPLNFLYRRSAQSSVATNRYDRLDDYARSLRSRASGPESIIAGQTFLLHLDHYRNDFAKAFTAQVDSPSSGNYKFEFDSEGLVHFFMYGKDGRVLLALDPAPVKGSGLFLRPYPDEITIRPASTPSPLV